MWKYLQHLGVIKGLLGNLADNMMEGRLLHQIQAMPLTKS
jgi:hypothetical protein